MQFDQERPSLPWQHVCACVFLQAPAIDAETLYFA